MLQVEDSRIKVWEEAKVARHNHLDQLGSPVVCQIPIPSIDCLDGGDGCERVKVGVQRRMLKTSVLQKIYATITRFLIKPFP